MKRILIVVGHAGLLVSKGIAVVVMVIAALVFVKVEFVRFFAGIVLSTLAKIVTVQILVANLVLLWVLLVATSYAALHVILTHLDVFRMSAQRWVCTRCHSSMS